MKIYDRYFLKQIVIVHIGTLAIFSFLVAIFTLITTCRQNAPLLIALKVLPYAAPQILSITMPLASTIAIFTAYGLMRENREFLALKALGIPVWRAFAPAWVYFFLISLMCVCLSLWRDVSRNA